MTTHPAVNAVDDVRVAALEARLADLEARLQEIMYVVSHDLPAPVRKVRTFLDLADAESPGLSDDARHYMSRAQAAAEHMGAMLDRLLELSRVATQQEAPVRCDLDEASRAAWDSAAAGREGRLDVATDLPVRADPKQLRLLLDALFTNSFDHAEGRPVHVHVGAERRGDRVRVQVRDEGPGFDPELAERVMRLFHVLRPGEHVGAGLAIARRIVAAHGGTMMLEPVPDQGVTAVFDLPAV